MKPKILIVDNQEEIRLMIKIILKRAGDYEYIEASDGKSGYDAALNELPHLILMDGVMPIMDGFESIKLIRDNPKIRNIPILMMSALSNSDDKVKALSSGISDFIAKPFDKTELIIRVNSLLHLYLKFEQKRLELEDINTHLEQKVNERLDRRVEEIRLASIGEVTAGITHELNTPVTYMKSNIELLGYDIEDIKDNEKIKESMLKTKVILESGVSRLKNIIDSTREIAKKGSDEKELNNLYSTIIHSTRMVYSRAKHLAPIYINKKPFTLELDENSEIFNANIIKQKMEQVWIIILNNASDEFENSSKNFEDRKIDIEIFNKNSKIVIKIKDNAGDGIPEHILPNIFNPFASTKVNKGMGVGLNIAKQIIELHNGTIRAYNEDKCAVFYIEI